MINRKLSTQGAGHEFFCVCLLPAGHGAVEEYAHVLVIGDGIVEARCGNSGAVSHRHCVRPNALESGFQRIRQIRFAEAAKLRYRSTAFLFGDDGDKDIIVKS